MTLDEFINKSTTKFLLTSNVSDVHLTNIGGFGCSSPKEILEKVLIHRDSYYLPAALFVIYYGIGVDEDKNFSASAIKNLLEDFKHYDPAVKFVYSHFLYSESRVNEALLILNKLSNEGFGPAYVALAEIEFRDGNKARAISLYEEAVSEGNLLAAGLLSKTKYKGTGVFGSIRHFLGSLVRLCSMLINPQTRQNFGVSWMYFGSFRQSD